MSWVVCGMETKSGSISILVTVEARIAWCLLCCRTKGDDVANRLRCTAKAELFPTSHHLVAIAQPLDVVEIMMIGRIVADGGDDVAERHVDEFVTVAVLLLGPMTEGRAHSRRADA